MDITILGSCLHDSNRYRYYSKFPFVYIIKMKCNLFTRKFS